MNKEDFLKQRQQRIEEQKALELKEQEDKRNKQAERINKMIKSFGPQTYPVETFYGPIGTR